MENEKISKLMEENRRLNRFRNGVLWISVYAACFYILVFMFRAARVPGHWWEFFAFGLPLLLYVFLFLIANSKTRE